MAQGRGARGAMRIGPARQGFTMIEVMIVVLVVAVLLMIAIPGFIRSRTVSRQRSCQSNLRQVDHAKEQFAMENRLSEGAEVTLEEIMPDYIKRMNMRCPAGGDYTIRPVGLPPACTLENENPPHILNE